jgi:hypothetical protein
MLTHIILPEIPPGAPERNYGTSIRSDRGGRQLGKHFSIAVV